MKTDRHARIIELISENDIEKQEELVNLLNKEGFKVTQATVSRDIRQLKLVKVALKNGKQKYAVNNIANDEAYAEKYRRILKETFISADCAQNILVIKTVPGMAMSVGAVVDAIELEGCLGCIAGDNTIVTIMKTADAAIEALHLLRELAQ